MGVVVENVAAIVVEVVVEEEEASQVEAA